MRTRLRCGSSARRRRTRQVQQSTGGSQERSPRQSSHVLSAARKHRPMPVEDFTTQACSFASVPSPESPASSDRSETAGFLHPSQASTFSSLWCALETNLSHKEAFCRHDSAYLHEPFLQWPHPAARMLCRKARSIAATNCGGYFSQAFALPLNSWM